MTPSQAHEFNIDVAQREIDGRAALGEDMTSATICPRTYAIVKPQPARLLNQAQAEAVYSAMCALNNVGTICGDLTLAEGLRVQWLESVTVRDGLSGPREEYTSQYAFATAYGLQQG